MLDTEIKTIFELALQGTIPISILNKFVEELNSRHYEIRKNNMLDGFIEDLDKNWLEVLNSIN